MITRRRALVLLAIAGLAAACVPPNQPPPLPPVPVPCDGSQTPATPGNDPLRTGWYPNQPGLNPNAGGQCAFGEQWAAPVDGQLYAQPIVDPGAGPNGTLLVATETNHVYGFDAVTGQQLWERNDLGPPWDPNELNCSDLVPSVGITSTPAIDAATHTAYMFSKTYDNGVPAYFAHAVDLNNGNEKPGFPVKIQGSANNDPTANFDAQHHLQRPGLLLMNGVVYAAFGGHCDTPPYRGWVVGVSTAGAITARWTDEALTVGNDSPAGGIWHAGGRLVSDKPGEILLASGNGVVSPAPFPGTTPPQTLGEAAIRLQVVTTPGPTQGQLQAKDFFSPCNAQDLSDSDSDIGSGAPLALPDSFGTSPHLVMIVGKEGTLYLLDRDNLGGYQQGSSSCPDGSGHAGDKVVSTFKNPNSPFGVWATPAVWPGDGGLIYLPYPPSAGVPGKFTAFKVTPDGNGHPTLSVAGQSSDAFGFGSSSAIITSDGTTSGSALVWITRFEGDFGPNAELLAYDANPAGGVLTLRGRWQIGQGNKFTTPTVDRGRIYVGARDGFVHAFGALPQAAAQSPPPPPPRGPTPAQQQAPDREG